tara:strand:+ start:123 stop:815 length:693 start_codon:yes stop_codon:yes gene_type:complete
VKLRRIIAIIFFIGGTTFTSGQNIALSFSSNNISLADTVAMGDTIWYNFWVVNDGNNVITDYISLNTARFCQAQGMINEREIGHVNPGALFPGDSIELPLGMLYEVVQQQNYLIGDNIVVIWPRVEVLDPQINEHLTAQLYVKNKSMISKIEDAIKSKETAFYFTDKTIHFLNKFSVSEVVLYNMLGNEVYRSNSPQLKKINLENTPKGTYLIVIRLIDGTIRKEKLSVQ